MTTLRHPTEVFPLAPEGGRLPRSAEPPSGPNSRPWVLRFARTPDATKVTPLPASVYDEERQVSIGVDTDLLPYMGTHAATVPDGNIQNPPKLDEGPKD
ncbi:putative ATP-grasp-modified RiPP [Streptomyces sp. NPDC057638]|uniref:putative ATP-grasp-modified RiPP n=1 Tax=Streptomyces sp. NPDC057638 TaxID=3346190 RepID=UPI0036C2239A